LEPDLLERSDFSFVSQMDAAALVFPFHCHVFSACALLEDDAVRVLEPAKENLLPEWSGLLGTLTSEAKQLSGLQATDLLVYPAGTRPG
jgi:hypothetical protein